MKTFKLIKQTATLGLISSTVLLIPLTSQALTVSEVTNPQSTGNEWVTDLDGTKALISSLDSTTNVPDSSKLSFKIIEQTTVSLPIVQTSSSLFIFIILFILFVLFVSSSNEKSSSGSSSSSKKSKQRRSHSGSHDDVSTHCSGSGRSSSYFGNGSSDSGGFGGGSSDGGGAGGDW